MKVSIMQPYFIPYIGYWQLIAAVDKFVIYDNVKYTKKGWINRNRLLSYNGVFNISVPIKKDSDHLNINQRFVSDESSRIFNLYLNKINNFYHKSPYFEKVYYLIEKILSFEDKNLFNFIKNSIIQILSYIEIDTTIINSSNIKINHKSKKEKRIVEICRALNAKNYINPIGGKFLYDKNYFLSNGIDLSFIECKNLIYKQFDYDFEESLSIIDVLMFNSINGTRKLLTEYKFS